MATGSETSNLRNEMEQGGERQSVSMPVRMVRGVLAGVLSDESFAIQTDEVRTCVRITRELAKCFHQPSVESEKFASWLINALDGVIEKSKKRTGMINQDKLWSKYHELTISEIFNVTWKQFLGQCELDQEPMLYQHITDELFEMCIKDEVCLTSEEDVCSEDHMATCLTFEEENAIRYVGGYVVRSLKQQKKHEDVFSILEELTYVSSSQH